MTRKEEILQVAQQILVDEGHYRLTMRYLAERVGMKLGSLQYHFPTKTALIQGLLATSLDHYHRLMLELMEAIVAEDDPLALRYLFATYQDEQTSGIFEQLWALSIQDEPLKRQYEAAYVGLWQAMAGLMAQFDAQAALPERQTRAALIIALLDGLETFLRSERLRSHLATGLETAVIQQIQAIAKGSRFDV